MSKSGYRFYPKYTDILKGTNILSGETTQPKLFCRHSEKESTLQGKNWLPLGANSFLVE